MPSAIGCSTRLLYPYLQKPHSLCRPHIAIRSSSPELALCDKACAGAVARGAALCYLPNVAPHRVRLLTAVAPCCPVPPRTSHCNERQPEVLTTSSKVQRQPTTATAAAACARARRPQQHQAPLQVGALHFLFHHVLHSTGRGAPLTYRTNRPIRDAIAACVISQGCHVNGVLAECGGCQRQTVPGRLRRERRYSTNG